MSTTRVKVRRIVPRPQPPLGQMTPTTLDLSPVEERALRLAYCGSLLAFAGFGFVGVKRGRPALRKAAMLGIVASGAGAMFPQSTLPVAATVAAALLAGSGIIGKPREGPDT